ncbi:hypothetical protein BU23DRAFT_645484 [Bimuria novae-zelandiae CBS 107.79]|uniref:Uncharacterized protein n=1 Tax=Bimuria novae-zelandiae CBS 107.79 TaxID=1447943 RepID=A0A6A5V6Q3_9PLEO|nr:hypothetical protein BU23DRAFT_645484 [Bimuria novae-zelandiae CBS 107.79]
MGAAVVVAVVTVLPDDNPDDSCTTKRPYPTCTTKFVVVTTEFPDLGSKTTSTDTISTCYTITACTGSATTVSTTTQSATTVQSLCEPKNCGGTCGARRRALEAIPTDPPSISRQTLASVPTQENQSVSLGTDLMVRDIPPPGSGDWSAFYKGILAKEEETILINNDNGVRGTTTALVQVIWGHKKQNIVVQGLFGCFALFCVSQIGAFVAHFWEGPSLINRNGAFETDVIDILKHYLGSDQNLYQLGPTPFCYVMGGTRGAIGDNGETEQATLTRSDPAGLKYQSQFNRVRDTIKTMLPRASVESYTYTRQVNPNLQDRGYGKGVVLFDNREPDRVPPGDDPDDWPTYSAEIAVYLQGYEAKHFYTPYQEVQIWRNHYGGKTRNTAVQAYRDTAVDYCAPGGNNGVIRAEKEVEHGSENTDVDSPFEIITRDGKFWELDCTYKGGPYAPTAASGAFAGELTCAVDNKFTCVRPEDNRARTCSEVPASDCGKLGVKCEEGMFFQLLATCKL